MISFFGQIALYFALCFSLGQSILPLIGFYKKNPYLLAVARPASIGQCVAIVIAYTLLTIAFVNSDFSIVYVAENSHASLPFMYRLTAVWGAHEGSILLWILMLNLWTLAYAHIDQSNIRPLVLAMLGIISVAFISFLIFTSSPFLIALHPLAGRDLNPLLQDVGFVIHPPMLYAGYVGFSVAFAITEGALLAKQLDANWANLTRRFALAAFCFLTFGILLGSWWAYRVLGWGGFWFWDPVENASLLPWLSGLALIHVLVLVEKRDTAKGWAALLAIISFSLSLLGTFLVRSGVLVSAHTFANDPKRGLYLLLVLATLLSAALAVYLSHTATNARTHFKKLSRETGLLLNSALLMLAMLTILLGTLYPLILDALHLGTISVGAPYFNLVMQPIVLVTMAVMGFAVLCRYQEQSLKELWQLSYRKLLLSFVLAASLLLFYTHRLEFMSFLALGLSFWIMATALPSLNKLRGMAVAHIGFAVFMIGIMLSATLNQEVDARVKPGDVTKIGPYEFIFIDTQGIKASNYKGIRAMFDVVKNTRHIVTLYPEKRIFLVREMVMTKVDIHPGLFRDLYIALGEPLDNDYWSVRIYYKPFVRWIWAGGILMLIGGMLAIIQRKPR